jgi:hypothetical protein
MGSVVAFILFWSFVAVVACAAYWLVPYVLGALLWLCSAVVACAAVLFVVLGAAWCLAWLVCEAR